MPNLYIFCVIYNNLKQNNSILCMCTMTNVHRNIYLIAFYCHPKNSTKSIISEHVSWLPQFSWKYNGTWKIDRQTDRFIESTSINSPCPRYISQTIIVWSVCLPPTSEKVSLTHNIWSSQSFWTPQVLQQDWDPAAGIQRKRDYERNNTCRYIWEKPREKNRPNEGEQVRQFLSYHIFL